MAGRLGSGVLFRGLPGNGSSECRPVRTLVSDVDTVTRATRIVVTELTEKLGETIVFDWRQLAASYVVGRSRAFRSVITFSCASPPTAVPCVAPRPPALRSFVVLSCRVLPACCGAPRTTFPHC